MVFQLPCWGEKKVAYKTVLAAQVHWYPLSTKANWVLVRGGRGAVAQVVMFCTSIASQQCWWQLQARDNNRLVSQLFRYSWLRKSHLGTKQDRSDVFLQLLQSLLWLASFDSERKLLLLVSVVSYLANHITMTICHVANKYVSEMNFVCFIGHDRPAPSLRCQIPRVRASSWADKKGRPGSRLRTSPDPAPGLPLVEKGVWELGSPTFCFVALLNQMFKP